MEKNIEELEAKLKRYNQQHLIDYYNKLEEGEIKDKFLKQLQTIDFEMVDNLYRNIKKDFKDEKDKIEPIEYWDKERLGSKYNFYQEIGE